MSGLDDLLSKKVVLAGKAISRSSFKSDLLWHEMLGVDVHPS